MSYRPGHVRLFEGEEFVFLAILVIYIVVEAIHYRKTGRFLTRRTSFWSLIIEDNITPEYEEIDFIPPSPTDPNAYHKPKPDDPTLGLEEAFHLNRKFTVGKFQAGITRKMHSTDSLAQMRILCVYLVNIPAEDAITFKIKVEKDVWNDACQAKGPKALARTCYWGVPDEELSARFKKKDCFLHLRRLIRTAGPCEILCSKGRFLVICNEGIDTTRDLINLRKHATDLFRCYAQVAQLKVPSWRSEDISYDWWMTNPLLVEVDEYVPDEEDDD